MLYLLWCEDIKISFQRNNSYTWRTLAKSWTESVRRYHRKHRPRTLHRTMDAVRGRRQRCERGRLDKLETFGDIKSFMNKEAIQIGECPSLRCYKVVSSGVG